MLYILAVHLLNNPGQSGSFNKNTGADRNQYYFSNSGYQTIYFTQLEAYIARLKSRLSTDSERTEPGLFTPPKELLCSTMTY
jgi:hypothetical protein